MRHFVMDLHILKLGDYKTYIFTNVGSTIYYAEFLIAQTNNSYDKIVD